MKKIIYGMIGVAIVSCTGNIKVSAQQSVKFRCGTEEAIQKMYKENPQLAADEAKFMAKNKAIMAQPRAASNIQYTIPVVFHILHEYGAENISDANVYDEMVILNKDYQLLNSDINLVVPEFQGLIGNAHMQFVLASKDPSGNCTNGIEHIYTHLTDYGSENSSKLQQWDRTSYLNIWVVRTMAPGSIVAGYSLFPSAVTGYGYTADGVMLLYDYLGSLPPSNVTNSRTITHEIGHYLGLQHPWGATNSPGVACGDDGISDTPITKGWDHCDLVNSAVCDPTIVENVQNFMDYSYCDRMFTIGQTSYMDATINNATSYRNNLPTAANLAHTGVNAANPLPAPLCSPHPDFFTTTRFVCPNTNVGFKNFTNRAAATGYEWDFTGASVSSSVLAEPTIKFVTPGWQQVSLTATNATGSETETRNNYIHVANSWVDFVGPHSETFENTEFDFRWLVDNPEDNEAKWKQVNNAGYQSSNCIALINMVDHPSPFYFSRLGGTTDAFITPAYDLSQTTSATLDFKYSCATNATNSGDISETLQVFSSVDCGFSWSPRKTISGNDLANAHNSSGVSYVPNSTDYWTLCEISLPGSLKNGNVRFKFEYMASDFSNNIYIDDINVLGVLDAPNAVQSPFNLELFPNPSLASGSFTITYFAGKPCDAEIKITNLLGEQIALYSEKGVIGKQKTDIQSSLLGMTPGIYFITVKAGTDLQTKKITVL